MFGLACKKDIDGKILYFPSEHFFNLWNKLPHKTINEIENKNRDRSLPIILPPPTPSKRVVLLVNDAGFFKPALRIDDMYYFSLNDTIAYSIEMDNDFDESTLRIKKALKAILSNKQWSSLPVYVVGWRMGGQSTYLRQSRRLVYVNRSKRFPGFKVICLIEISWLDLVFCLHFPDS